MSNVNLSKIFTEPIVMSDDFLMKNQANNRTDADAIKEFIDNAIDARVGGGVSVKLGFDDERHEFTCEDNGHGIKDMSKLLMIGGTDKRKDNDAIGKFGEGAVSAVATLVKEHRYSDNFPCIATYETACDGQRKEVQVCILRNAHKASKVKTELCPTEEHYTKITITNIDLRSCKARIIGELEETYEISMEKGIVSITSSDNEGTRQLGHIVHQDRTFVGDDRKDSCKCGKTNVYVLSRKVGKDLSSKKKETTEKTKLRFYSSSTFRLLCASTTYWKLFAKREVQPNVCGLRCGVFIETSEEAYKLFGMLAAKNNLTAKNYFEDDRFNDLKNILKRIYQENVSTTSKKEPKAEVIDGKTITIVKEKIDGLFSVSADGRTITMQAQYKDRDLKNLIIRIDKAERENRILKDKLANQICYATK